MKQRIEKEAESLLLTDYQRYYRVAYSYVRNEQDALDIVQESAYKVIRDCEKVREASYLSTWIYRVVVNTAIDFLRKTQKGAEAAKDLAVREGELVHEDQYQEDDAMELLAVLDEKDRTIVTLRFFEEMKLEEIAEVLGENVNTVKARLYRALKKLRDELRPEPSG